MPIQKRKHAPKRAAVRRKMLARRPRTGYPTMVNRGLQPIAQRTIVKMKYAEALTPSLTTGSPLYGYAWNLNSIFDPNRSGIGHQPYGHDTFATMYNRYRVIGCKYNIYVAPMPVSTSGPAVYPLQVAAIPSNEVEPTPAGLSEWREKPRCKYIIQAVGAPVRKLSGYVSIPSLTGRTKVQYMADDRYQAQVGSSPQELAILNTAVTWAGDSVESTSGAPFSYNIELTYVVEFFDPKVLPQS